MLRLLALLALLVVARADSGAASELSVDPDFPLRDQSCTLRVQQGGRGVPGVVVEVTYRAGSVTSASETLVPTDGNGEIVWTPTTAGLVELVWLDGQGERQSMHLAVRHGSFPVAGQWTLTFAALLLFGGSAVGLTVLLRE